MNKEQILKTFSNWENELTKYKIKNVYLEDEEKLTIKYENERFYDDFLELQGEESFEDISKIKWKIFFVKKHIGSYPEEKYLHAFITNDFNNFVSLEYNLLDEYYLVRNLKANPIYIEDQEEEIYMTNEMVCELKEVMNFSLMKMEKIIKKRYRKIFNKEEYNNSIEEIKFFL